MIEQNITVKLTTGEELTVPLNRYKPLANGVVTLNTDEGIYTIFPVGISYVFKGKISVEED